MAGVQVINPHMSNGESRSVIANWVMYYHYLKGFDSIKSTF